MIFTSDNSGPAAPAVMQAVADANDGYRSGYGADGEMAEVTALVRAAFDAPDAQVFLVSTGTAANALALATLAPPWGAIYCHRIAHVQEDECGAPEFYTGGAKLALVDGQNAKMGAEALASALAGGTQADVHQVQRGAVSITNATEAGGVYTASEVAALCDLANGYGLPCHMDGARFANALVAANATPAAMTHEAGIGALSFGGTKNGCLGVEAVVFFDPAKAWEFQLRRKRGGHLFSKHRYLSAQMLGYLRDDLWLSLARNANEKARALAEGITALGHPLAHPCEANMVFPIFRRDVHSKLNDSGARYYLWPHTATPDGPPEEEVTCRLVCNWATTDEDIADFLDLLKAG